MTDQVLAEYGALAKSLAKAQMAFPAIVRDKEVDSRSYKFKYAPLDSILSAVREPLATNGLAISQLLDGPDLVTMLLHESGAMLSGRMPLPHGNGETIQQLGSAITYLRRYSLQAILGIAAEEDDDGEAAGRNRPAAQAPIRQPDAEIEQPDGSLIGIAQASEKGDADFMLRQVRTNEWPEEHPQLIFRLVEGRRGFKVVAVGPLAEMVAEYREGIEGQRVQCWGVIEVKSFPKDGKTITYRQLALSRLKVGVLDLTEPDSEESDDETLTEELAQLAFPVPA